MTNFMKKRYRGEVRNGRELGGGKAPSRFRANFMKKRYRGEVRNGRELGGGKAPSRFRGQVSAELIIVIAAVLAVSLILVSQMQKTAKEGKAQLERGAKKVFDEIDQTRKMASGSLKRSGASCTKDEDCESGQCNWFDKKCA